MEILLSTDRILQHVTPPLTVRFSTAPKSNFSFFGGKELDTALWEDSVEMDSDRGGEYLGNDWSVAAGDQGADTELSGL